MFSAMLRKDGFIDGIGKPQIFVTQEDLFFVLQNASVREAFVDKYGQGICIGILGSKSMNGWVESELHLDLPADVNRRGNLSYYAKL